jgi:16S rRNA (guanine527-N7)-methyltransferase
VFGIHAVGPSALASALASPLARPLAGRGDRAEEGGDVAVKQESLTGNNRIAGPKDFAAVFDVSPAALGRLVIFERLLRQWQKAVNLVAPSTLSEIWHRHFADCAQLVALAPQATAWVDLGSGAGFPGLVVAIMLAERARPTLAGTTRAPSPVPRVQPPHHGEGHARVVTLIESDSRKCAFLREVVRQTGITSGQNSDRRSGRGLDRESGAYSGGAVASDSGGLVVDILSRRIPLPATQVRLGTTDVVSARALAPLDKLMALAAPLFAPATVGLFLKGRDVETEIEAARKAWTFHVDLVASITDASGRIAVIRHLKPKVKE